MLSLPYYLISFLLLADFSFLELGIWVHQEVQTVTVLNMVQSMHAIRIAVYSPITGPSVTYNFLELSRMPDRILFIISHIKLFLSRYNSNMSHLDTKGNRYIMAFMNLFDLADFLPEGQLAEVATFPSLNIPNILEKTTFKH
ncbi:hypothetical protein CPB84DRAFT_1749408 [Gymnopilus junonius]|uniref:Uncharacterized protein n=1 Tax=Gymnopilus junonius TaxID=109634 RepID=A0A9P5NHW0_GYMJU|nr:hypothetical protein CPB84DRAFT_1749408 [Gymnopilus junonius]